MIQVAQIRKYRGANILILNNWQSFVYVIFYRKQFYANEITIAKPGEYTNLEYVRALDGVLIAAKRSVDMIRERSSWKSKLKNVRLKFQRKESGVPGKGPEREAGAEGEASKVPSEG